METKLSRLELPSGRHLIFEDGIDLPGGERLVSITDIGERIDYRTAVENIKSAAEILFNSFRSLGPRPEQCELEFGIKLSAAAGAVLAKAGGEASFTVKLSWSLAEPSEVKSPENPSVTSSVRDVRRA